VFTWIPSGTGNYLSYSFILLNIIDATTSRGEGLFTRFLVTALSLGIPKFADFTKKLRLRLSLFYPGKEVQPSLSRIMGILSANVLIISLQLSPPLK
jgi:hypothetical protein